MTSFKMADEISRNLAARLMLTFFLLLTWVVVTFGHIRAAGVVIATSQLCTFVATDAGRPTALAFALLHSGAGIFK